MKKVLSAIAMAMALAIVNATLAGVPQLINFQGKLTDENGDPLTGSYDLIFALWTHQTNTDISFCEWSETHTSVTVTDGLFNVILGSVNTVTLRAVFEVNDILYLEKTVGTETLTPRVQLGSAGFSLRAEGVSDEAITEDSLADDAVTASKLDVAAIDASGKIPELSSSTFTNLSGGNLTNLNASNITSGMVDPARIENSEYFIDSPGSPGQVWKSDGDEAGYWGTGTGAGGSLWAESESDIYYSAGNVGIGTTNPATRLDARVSTTDGEASPETHQSYPIAMFKADSSGGGKRGLEIGAPAGSVASPVYIKVSGTCARLSFIDQDDTENMVILDNGNVGIGDDSPDASLEIVGNFFVSQTDQADGNWFCVTGGNVGIGTCSPTERLEVEGSIAISQTVTANDFSGSAVSLTDLNAWNITTGIVDSDRVEFGEYFIDSPGTLGQFWKSDGDGRGQWETVTEGGGSLWSESGSDIYYSTGNVGIGTAAPKEKLDFAGSGNIRLGVTATTGKLYLYKFSDTNQAYISSDGGGGITFTTGVSAPTQRVVFDDTGNVGIGTTGPGSKLTVLGGNIALRADNDATDAITMTSGTTEGYVYVNNAGSSKVLLSAHSSYDSYFANKLAVGATDAGTAQLYVNGNVGIGTTGPGAKLDVRETATYAPPINVQAPHALTKYVSTGGYGTGYIGMASGYMTGTPAGMNLRADNVPISFGAAGSAATHMVITTAGNVGIGTTGPSHSLHVVGTAITYSDMRSIMYLGDDTAMAAGVGGGIVFGGNYLTGGGITDFAAIWAEKENGVSAEHGGQLHLGTRRNGGSVLQSDLVIDSNGNIGIGTTSPEAILDVRGTLTGIDELILSDQIDSKNYITGPTNRSLIIRTGNINDNTDEIGFNIDTDATTGLSYARVMTIDPSGNVGIGTTSPSAKLDVNGNAKINGTLDMKHKQVKNFVIETRASDPPLGELVTGRMWLIN